MAGNRPGLSGTGPPGDPDRRTVEPPQSDRAVDRTQGGGAGQDDLFARPAPAASAADPNKGPSASRNPPSAASSGRPAAPKGRPPILFPLFAGVETLPGVGYRIA